MGKAIGVTTKAECCSKICIISVVDIHKDLEMSLALERFLFTVTFFYKQRQI